MTKDLANLTISSTAEKMRKKEISARELLEFYRNRIDSKNKEIFAFLCVNDQSQSMADASDARYQKGETKGALDGVVIAVKDNLCLKDTITTAGSKILANYKAPYTSTVLEKLANAGTVFIGKTNLDEFAMGSSTENSAFGLTKNPRDISRVPGGSSGGSAAAVAADMCSAALGSDTGGSIRQPASYCGVVGFKPSYGAVSRYGLIAYGSSLDQVGPITKNVADARTIFEAIRGVDPKDSTTVEYNPVRQKGDKLKIGLIKLDPAPEDPAYQTFLSAIEKIKTLPDVEIGEATLPNLEYSLSAYYIIALAEASSNLSRFDGIKYGFKDEGENLAETYRKSRGEGFGAEVRRRIILGTFVLSSGYYDAYYKKAMQVRTKIREDFAKAFTEFDVLLMPVAPGVAFKFGEKSASPLEMYLSDIYTVPVNLAGIPAISLPCGLETETKMPVGLQVLGNQGADDLVLDVAEKIEKELKCQISK